MFRLAIILAFAIASASTVFGQQTPQGSLEAQTRSGKAIGSCPLKRTNVRAEISGFFARVNVEQEFENNFDKTIEAVYLFPLSANGAVDSMKMTIGSSTIRGKMMTRDEAQKRYKAAANAGKTASILDQERPNVFTQSVANIQPGDKILVEISYVETLKFDDGAFEFTFPMTVAPRYSPSSASTVQTVNPVYSATRSGHDISIEVSLNAGVPVESIKSTSHKIETLFMGANGGKITLRDETTIPNKDFVLRYDVTGKKIEDALFTHFGSEGGYFSLILQPPDNFRFEDVTPREIVFVLDSSGSMDGFPIEKAKEAINLSLDGLYPDDTFNIITFAGSTDVLFPEPVPATRYNLDVAREFLERNGAGGGTEMMKAVEAALKPSASTDHVRIVSFMTDGLVGNEREIIGAVQKYSDARVFSFGIGNSTNRFLLDRIAEAGRGEATYISLSDDGSAAARKFYERIRSPLLTDISIDWNGLPVTQVLPGRIGDLFSAKPVVIFGRYSKAASGTITLRGKSNGQPFERKIEVSLPESKPENSVLGSLWARKWIEHLTADEASYDDAQFQTLKPAAQSEITEIALKHSIMTEFTSFIAVDEQVRGNGKQTKILVPNEPQDDGSDEPQYDMPRPIANVTGLTLKVNPRSPSVPRVVSGGVVNGKAVELVQPKYPAAAMAVRTSGTVMVQVEIDEKGSVVSATAVSGHPLLRAASVAAARASRFTVTLFNGRPIRTKGVIAYNFRDDNSRWRTEAKPLPPGELEEVLRPARKLHFWVFDLFDKIENGRTGAAIHESDYVRDGVASVQIKLSASGPGMLEKLNSTWFVGTIATDGSAVAIGTIPVERIRELIEINEVSLVFPRI